MRVTESESGYRFLPGVRQYSAGVAAEPDYSIVRVQFSSPLPIDEGFPAAAWILGAAGRPAHALCACEIRSPEPFTEEGFEEFNDEYVSILQDFSVIQSDGANPVARTNVCPALFSVAKPSLHAFSFTVPSGNGSSNFVVSGSAEVPEGAGNYRDHIESFGDVSGKGLRAKVRFVSRELTRRMKELGRASLAPQVLQIYSVHNVYDLIVGEVAEQLRVRHGFTWHHARPPIVGLEFEMDCRSVDVDRVVAASGSATVENVGN